MTTVINDRSGRLLVSNFLDLVVREQYKVFGERLTNGHWDQNMDDCRGRDPQMPEWHKSTRRRLRSSIFQILAQAGFLRTPVLSSCRLPPTPTTA